MIALERDLVLAGLLLIAFDLLSAVKVRYDASQDDSSRTLELRPVRDANITAEENGESNGGERNVDWLGRHWYIFVVFVVMVIVVFVFVCACFVRRTRLGTYHMQIHQNGNRYSPHVNSSRHTVSTRSSAHSAYHSPQHSSTLTEDAASSVTPHTGSSFLDIPNSPAGGGGLSAGAPPTFGANESPWSFIQSVAKSKERHVNERERERGRREGRDSSHANKLKTSNSHRRHHHRYHSHPTSYLHRWHHNSQKRRFSNPLNKVNGAPDESGTSLCSIPSTSGSMHSDPSNHSSHHSNRARSNPSSHSHSDNSTVVEVNVNVHLSPNRLDRAKVITMAALAESARQLAESAANLGGREEKHFRSLPHSPYPPPRNSKRPTRHSITGAPLTPPSLPPSSPFDRKHLLQSHSSSHLPPLRRGSCDARVVDGSRSSSPQNTISLDRNNVRHYYTLSHMTDTGAGCCDKDSGTVVSLDHTSLSSSCHGHSMAACDSGQRSSLTQSPLGKREAAILSFDCYSNGGSGESDVDVTMVSLDRADRTSDHRTRNYPQTTCSRDASGCNESGSGVNSPAGNGGNYHRNRAHKLPHHVKQDSHSSRTQQTAPLYLDSQIEDVPIIKQPSGKLHDTGAKSNDQNVFNGCLYHPIPHHTFSYLLSSNPPSPKLPAVHQKLQNISEQGESECFHSSDNFELGEEAMYPHGQHRHSVDSSAGRPAAGPGLMARETGVEITNLDQVKDTTAAKRRVKGVKRKRKKERQDGHGEAEVAHRNNRDGEISSNIVRGSTADGEETTDGLEENTPEPAKVGSSPQVPLPVSLRHDSLRVLYDNRNHTPSPPQQLSHSTPSPLSDPLSSSSLDKTHSPLQSGSAVSISEALSSTASGYAATGESGSTCEVEVRSSGSEHVPEFEDIQKALFEARSQFSYPLQRLLDQDCAMDRIELVEAASTPHILSHSQPTQSHAGSEYDQFQTHSQSSNGRLQHTQSVNV